MSRASRSSATAPANAAGGFKGNKSFLPSKPCLACGRPMAWRKAWAKNWDEVRWCSEPCRRRGRSAGGSATPGNAAR